MCTGVGGDVCSSECGSQWTTRDRQLSPSVVDSGGYRLSYLAVSPLSVDHLPSYILIDEQTDIGREKKNKPVPEVTQLITESIRL